MSHNSRGSLLVGLVVYALITALCITSTPAQPCPHDGDVNQDGSVNPGDALLALQHYLGLASPPLSACQQDHANVNDPDGSTITPSDALCIFQRFLGLPSCLDLIDPARTNNFPVVQDDPSTTDAGVPVSIAVLANDTDPDGNVLSIAAVVPLPTTQGTMTVSGPNIIYTPPGGSFSGTDVFTYRACDNGIPVLCGTAQVTVTINAVNTPPSVANPLADITVDEDAPNTVLDLSATFSDPDIATNGDRLTLSVLNNSNQVLLTTNLVNTQLTLTYLPDRNGVALITIRATDQGNGFVDDTFRVTVNPINDSPKIIQLPTRRSVVGRKIPQAQQVSLRNDVRIEDAEDGLCSTLSSSTCKITVSNLPFNLQILNDTIQGIIAYNAFSRGDGGGPIYTVTVTATDSNGSATTGTFEWRVAQGTVEVVDAGISGEGDGDGDGDSNDGDGGADGDASDGGDASPLAGAICTFVDMNGQPFVDSQGQVLLIQKTADPNGKFLLPIPVDPQNRAFVMALEGFVECRVPDKPGLAASTYLNTTGIRRGERLTGLKVEPKTTVGQPLADGLRAANAATDLVAVQARLLDDTSGLQTGSPREITRVENNDPGCDPPEPTTTVTDSIDIPLQQPAPTNENRNKTRLASYIASQLFLAAFKGNAVAADKAQPIDEFTCLDSDLAEGRAPETFLTALKTYYSMTKVTAGDLLSLGLQENDGLRTGPTRGGCG